MGFPQTQSIEVQLPYFLCSNKSGFVTATITLCEFKIHGTLISDNRAGAETRAGNKSQTRLDVYIGIRVKNQFFFL